MDLEFFENLQNRNKLIGKDKEGNNILEKLNTLINGDKWKQRFAICVLSCVLEKCDPEVFEEHATAWMRFIMKLINTIPSENLLRMCFALLSKLLEYSSGIDKLSRDIATKGMDPLLALLVGTSVPLTSEKIYMLKCCILYFPASCGHYRSSLLKLVIGAIESDDSLVYSAACQLFTLIATCGTAGEKKNRLAENWVKQLYQVINSTLYYISKLRHKASVKIDDDTSINIDTSKLILFSEVSEKIDISAAKISVRIERLLLMLQHIIGTAMAFEVSFPLLRLLNVFCELSNLLHIELKDTEGFNLIIIKLTDALLKCIVVCVNQLKSTLLMFSQQLTTILTSVISLGFFTNRCNLYQCTVSMLQYWKVLPKHVHDLFLLSIFTDIKIYDKEENKTHRRDDANNLANDINEQNRKEITRYDYTLCQNAYAALKLLEKILVLNGPLLCDDNLTSIMSNVSTTLVSIYRGVGFASPYSYSVNRLMLLKVAKCLLLLHHGSVQIPVSILLSHFIDGSTELHDEIKAYCNEVLLQYDSLMHSIHLGFHGGNTDYIQHDLIGSCATGPLEMYHGKDIKIEAEQSYPSLNGNGHSKDNSNSRLCGSADHVLAKETKADEVPRRSSAESVVAFSSNQISTKTNWHNNNFSSSIVPSNNNLTSFDSSIRLCSSADQVLAKEVEPVAMPRRSCSEPTVIDANNDSAAPQKITHNAIIAHSNTHNAIIAHSKTNNALITHSNSHNAILTHSNSHNAILTHSNSHNAIVTHNTTSSDISIHIDDDNPSPDKECVAVEDAYDEGDMNYEDEDEYDDGGPVVISDSSEDDVALTKSIRKYSTKGSVGTNLGVLGNLDVPSENMYVPRPSKRAKISTSGSTIQYSEDDEEYILSTFCDETNADDL